MKIKRLGIIFCGVVVLVFLTAAIWLFHANDLGLTGFDIMVGGRSEMETVRANTKTVADAFLAQHKTDLLGESTNKYDLVLDYSKSSKIRSLGYRSSFYFYCWSIYLPYSVRADSNGVGTVAIQLLDKTPGNGHDPQKFHVIRAKLLDNQGKVIKEIEQPQ